MPYNFNLPTYNVDPVTGEPLPPTPARQVPPDPMSFKDYKAGVQNGEEFNALGETMQVAGMGMNMIAADDAKKHGETKDNQILGMLGKGFGGKGTGTTGADAGSTSGIGSMISGMGSKGGGSGAGGGAGAMGNMGYAQAAGAFVGDVVATSTSKAKYKGAQIGKTAGGGIGGVIGGIYGGPMGAQFGQMAGSLIGGGIGSAVDNKKLQRDYEEFAREPFRKLHVQPNIDPYGSASSYMPGSGTSYMKDGGYVSGGGTVEQGPSLIDYYMEQHDKQTKNVQFQDVDMNDPVAAAFARCGIYTKSKRMRQGGAVPGVPHFQGGGATRADSVFLLNNNKVIDALTGTGKYTWSGKRPISDKSPWPGQFKVITSNLDTNIDFDIRKGYRGHPASDYKTVKGKMVGASDWLPGGGDDYGVPMQYLHPDIKPQFKGDLHDTKTIDKNKQLPSVFSYGYDELAITPWDMLTPAQQQQRVQKYGTTGTPYTSVAQATTKKGKARPVPSDQSEQLRLYNKEKAIYEKSTGLSYDKLLASKRSNVPEGPAYGYTLEGAPLYGYKKPVVVKPRKKTDLAQLINNEPTPSTLELKGRPAMDVKMPAAKTNYSFTYRTPEGGQSNIYLPDYPSWENFMKDKTYTSRTVTGDKSSATASGYFQKGGAVESEKPPRPLNAWETYNPRNQHINTEENLLPLADPNKFKPDVDWMKQFIKGRSEQAQSLAKGYNENLKANSWLGRTFGTGFDPIEESDKRIHKAINNVSTVGFYDTSVIADDSYVPLVSGQYSPWYHKIYIPDYGDDQGTRAHEIGHSTGLASWDPSVHYITQLRDTDAKFKEFKDPDDKRYLGSPSEIYSRIWDVRRNLGLKPEDVVTPEFLNENRGRLGGSRLTEYLSDETILKLLNNLVKNKPNTRAPMFAKQGGAVSRLGYSDNSPYRNAPFLDINTPSGLIDMRNTSKDLVGIDETGHQIQMQANNPEMYQFPGTQIREIPYMQKGGYTEYLGDQLFNKPAPPPSTFQYKTPIYRDTPLRRSTDIGTMGLNPQQVAVNANAAAKQAAYPVTGEPYTERPVTISQNKKLTPGTYADEQHIKMTRQLNQEFGSQTGKKFVDDDRGGRVETSAYGQFTQNYPKFMPGLENLGNLALTAADITALPGAIRGGIKGLRYLADSPEMFRRARNINQIRAEGDAAVGAFNDITKPDPMKMGRNEINKMLTDLDLNRSFENPAGRKITFDVAEDQTKLFQKVDQKMLSDNLADYEDLQRYFNGVLEESKKLNLPVEQITDGNYTREDVVQFLAKSGDNVIQDLLGRYSTKNIALNKGLATNYRLENLGDRSPFVGKPGQFQSISTGEDLEAARRQKEFLMNYYRNPANIPSDDYKKLVQPVSFNKEGGLIMDNNATFLKKGGKNWIKGAVNPAHKGYCTPMTKSTCTPRRKAFARTMKKHHGFHEEGGLINNNMRNPIEDLMYEDRPSETSPMLFQQNFPGGQMVESEAMYMQYGGEAEGQEEQQEMQEAPQQQMQAPQQPQGPQKSMINIEKGELLIDPMDEANEYPVVRKYDNPNRYSSHNTNPQREPIGNFTLVTEGLVVIPKKYARRYEYGDLLTRRSIIAEILKNQVNNPEDSAPRTGAGAEFAQKGARVGIDPATGLPYEDEFVPSQTMPAVTRPAYKYNPKPTIIQTPKYTAPGTGAAPKYPAAPGFVPSQTMPDVDIPDANYMDYLYKDNRTKNIDPFYTMPHRDLIENASVTQTNTDVRTDPKVRPEGGGINWDMAAGKFMSALPTAYGITNALGADPYLHYDENYGFNDAMAMAGGIETSPNFEASRGEMNQRAAGFMQQLNNINSPSVRSEAGKIKADLIKATGELSQQGSNLAMELRNKKRDTLMNLKVAQGGNRLDMRQRLMEELRQDKANRENLVHQGLSEMSTNYQQGVMDKERIKSMNSVAKFFRLHPELNELLGDNQAYNEALYDIIPALVNTRKKAAAAKTTKGNDGTE